MLPIQELDADYSAALPAQMAETAQMEGRSRRTSASGSSMGPQACHA